MNDIQRAIEELRYQEDMKGKGIPYQVDSLDATAGAVPGAEP